MGTENTGTSQRVHHGHNIASARRMKGLVRKNFSGSIGYVPTTIIPNRKHQNRKR